MGLLMLRRGDLREEESSRLRLEVERLSADSLSVRELLRESDERVSALKAALEVAESEVKALREECRTLNEIVCGGPVIKGDDSRGIARMNQKRRP
jgi:hypothetical protein